MKRIGFEDIFSILGKYENILEHFGLDPAGIARKSLAFHAIKPTSEARQAEPGRSRLTTSVSGG